MPTPEPSELIIAPTTNADMAAVLGGMHDGLMRAAHRAAAVLTDGQQYTVIEKKAIEAVEALRLLNGWDLAALLERGRILKEIEDKGYASVFPGDFQNTEQIAKSVGISSAEVSDTRALCEIIFPWIEANTGKSVSEWWEEVGKSKFREMVPVLKVLITGEGTSGRDSVAQSVTQLLDNVQASATAAGEGELETEELHARAVAQVLEFGSLPVREMRQQIRPVRTANIPAVRINRGEDAYVVLKADSQQLVMLNRLLGTHVDVTPLSEEDGRPVANQLARLRL
jgi:hypothetical protein